MKNISNQRKKLKLKRNARKNKLYFYSLAIVLFLSAVITISFVNSSSNKNYYIPAAHAAQPPGYTLSWADEFDSKSLDTNCSGSTGTWTTYFCAWNTRRVYGNSDDGVKMDDNWKGINSPAGSKTIKEVLTEAGWPLPSLHEVSNGTLKMRAYPIPTGYQQQFNWYGVVASVSAASMISSEMSHSQTYGYWEARLRLNQPPKNKHFSLWLLPKDAAWPPEIDMLETVIDNNNQQAGILSTLGSHGSSEDKLIFFTPTGGMLNVWHAYGFEWTPSTLNWYVDGQLMRTQQNYINKPMYILATWENGGNWEGDTNTSTPWPGEMEVDYIRVYKMLPTPTPIPPTPTPKQVVTVFSDNFDSAMNWTKAGNVSWYTGSPKIGTHSVRLVKTGSITKTISLAGYHSATVSFKMGANSLDTNSENVQALYYNGSAWVVLAQINNGSANENNQLNPYAFTLPSTVDNKANFQLRFKINGSGTGDYGYVDDVKVTATAN